MIALVAGATRGGSRGVAVELGAAGATVYVTGRSSRATGRSPMDRPETIEETAELVDAAGGTGIAVRVDHTEPKQVKALVERIEAEQGRLDVLVNGVWGGDPLTRWDTPFWAQDLDDGLEMQRLAVQSHIVTSHFAAELMVRTEGKLIVEVTDGIDPGYRGSLYYDLAKASVIRLALAMAGDLRPHGVAAVALTPGFLRSEAMLDNFGVTAETWREGGAKDPHFLQSETPAYLGRAVVALATDPKIMDRTGQALATWHLAREYGFTDADGTQPDWGGYFKAVIAPAG
jgi:NAD(P)-dependent dehydrogenase (short-subunit alcohol dehydrogenase family)